ncbi:unnamed protein product, partial [Choristocarpus tenellus]
MHPSSSCMGDAEIWRRRIRVADGLESGPYLDRIPDPAPREEKERDVAHQPLMGDAIFAKLREPQEQLLPTPSIGNEMIVQRNVSFALPLEMTGVGLDIAKGDNLPEPHQDQSKQHLQRGKRLRRKRLAEKVVTHWKKFAHEGMASIRARRHAEVKLGGHALRRWHTHATALRHERHSLAAAHARWHVLAESRTLNTWLNFVRHRIHAKQRQLTILNARRRRIPGQPGAA